MKRVFQREFKEEETEAPRRITRIGVTGLNEGNGATFVATSLACAMAEKKMSVAFAEIREGILTKPLLYDGLAMDRRFRSRTFYDTYRILKAEGSIRGVRNMDENINWLLMTHDAARQGLYLTGPEKLRLIGGVSEDALVCDIDDREDLETLLHEFDLIIAVIDPMPSKILSSGRLITQIKGIKAEGRGPAVCWVINKFNKGVSRRRLAEHLKIRDAVRVPLIRSDWFYTAEYNCRIPYRQREICEKIKKPLEEIINHHITIT